MKLWRAQRKGKSALGAVTLALLCFGIGARKTVLAEGETYEIVIAKVWVMDPVSWLDAVRKVGISDGNIRVVSSGPLKVMQTFDAKVLGVAAGVIVLHEQG